MIFSKNYLRIKLLLIFLFTSYTLGCSNLDAPLTPDPNWQSDELKNGFRYHIYQKKNEPVELRLIVHSGAYHESLNQYGYAHFLEHMAFNGSKHFSAQESVKFFEEIGLTMGPDLNAYTSYGETVYEISLPDNTSLDTALLWFRDIGDALLLTPQELEKEKGVVLDELRESQNGIPDTGYQVYDLMLQGSELEGYEILGSESSISNMNREQLVDYYQSWYRPNNAELIIVGDIDPDKTISLIESTFSSWEKSENLLSSKVNLQHTSYMTPELIVPPDGELSSVSLIHPRGETATLTQKALYDSLTDDMAYELITERIKSRAFELNVPLTNHYGGNFAVHNVNYGFVSAYFSEQDREISQQFLAQELSNLRTWGVTQAEFDTALSGYKNYLQNIDAEIRQLSSLDIVYDKEYAILNGEVYQSDDEYKSSLNYFVRNLDIESMNQVIAEILIPENQKVIFATTISADSVEFDNFPIHQQAKYIKQVMASEGRMIEVDRVTAELPFPKNEGEIVSFSKHNDALYLWKLANGVEVWLKQMSEAEQYTYFQYVGKGGSLAMDKTLNPAIEIALPAMIRSDLVGLDAMQLDRFLTQEQIHLTPELDLSSQSLYMASINSNLNEAFSLLRAAATDVAVSPSQLPTVKHNKTNQQQEYLESNDGKFVSKIRDALYGKGSALSIVSPEAIQQVEADQLDRIYESLFRQDRRFKLVMVSAKSPEHFDPLLKRYIANISYSTVDSVPQKLTLLKGDKVVTQSASNIDEMEYALIYTSEDEVADTKALFTRYVLQNLLERRINAKIREELGLDYGPSAGISTFDTLPLRSVWFNVTADSDKFHQIKDELHQLVTTTRKGFTQHELDIAKKQVITDLEQYVSDPIEVLYTLKRYLVADYDVEAFYQSRLFIEGITLEDVNQLMRDLTGPDAVVLEGILR